jgi:superfamily II DNA/RNA helicase
VVITPTKELAIKIHNEARKFAQGSMVAYGGTSVNYQAAQLTKGCNILVATPGRLMDYVDKGRIAFSALKYLVLDEADRMLDIGFMPDIQRCVTSPNMPEKGSR